MINRNRTSYQFESASQILRQRLRPIQQQQEQLNGHINKRHSNSDYLSGDNQDSGYLFGDNADYAEDTKRDNKKKDYIQSQNAPRCQTFNLSNDAIPLKRKANRAQSESFKQVKTTKSKKKYRKQENVGNAIVQQKKFNTIFKSICQPNGNITVNSLGHALQKYKVKFQIKDVVDMLKLNNQNQEDKIDNEEDLDMQVCLNQGQFKQLYQALRKKRIN